jgi:glycosyltransferase involved in cell wall biosynthesis
MASARASACAFEIVYVDDGSTDNSLSLLRDIESRASNVRVIAHRANRGQSRAILTGIHAARSNIVVTLDDDLQYQPSDIVRLLAALEDATPSTLVIGVADRIKRPVWRGIAGSGANLVSNLFLAKRLPLQLTTFCAFRKQLCAYFDPASEKELPLFTALVQAAGATRTVPIRLNASTYGASRYGLSSLMRLFLSRSRYYRLSKIVAWAAGALLVMVACALLLLIDAGNPILPMLLLPLAGVIFLQLVALALSIERRDGESDMLRANRAA